MKTLSNIKTYAPRALAAVLLFSFIPLQIGCTKEKAEALKTVAKDFRTQASVAIDKLDRLFIDDVAIAPLSKEDDRAGIIEALKTGSPGVTTIRTIVENSGPPTQDTSNYTKKLNQVRKTYEEFEGMFDDLSRGHYFAGDAVAKSDKLAKKLVAQMVFLAKYVKDHPFKLNARLELAEEMRERARAETNALKQENMYVVLAAEISAIRTDTKAANDAAILECAKGAEIGLRVVNLIQNYKKISITEILSIVRDGLTKVNQLTGKNTDALMKRVEEITATISADVDWAAILGSVTAEMTAV